MDEAEGSNSCVEISKERADSLYPMYFGVSCAFVALKLLSRSDNDDEEWLQIRDKMLQGSSHLLGILLWKIQRREFVEGRSELLNMLRKTQIEVEELKKRRSEDAKANQKVVCIYATQEQNWLCERRKLRQQISNLVTELDAQNKLKEETIANLTEKTREKELKIQSRDEALEEAEAKRKEVEDKLQKAEAVAVELRDALEQKSQKHSSEIWKHKTAFLELVSNQRQLEAEMGRALRQAEATKEELDAVFKEKQESVLMVQKLSVEVVKLHKDSEQKEKILSAMLRKSKFDTSEREMLLKEVKIYKVKRKQAQLEMERYKLLHELRHERHSSKDNSVKKAHSTREVFSEHKDVHSTEADYIKKQWNGTHSTESRSNTNTLLFQYMRVDQKEEKDYSVAEKTINVVPDSSNQYPPRRGQFALITTDVKQLEGWVRSETEKNTTMLEQRHRMEIDAFAEQLRLKDEKLEAFRWQLLTMELESKQLQSRTEELEKCLPQLRKENMKLEAMLLDYKVELESLNKGIETSHGNIKCNTPAKDLTTDHKSIWSDVKIIRTKPSGEVETKCVSSREVDSGKEEPIPIEVSLMDKNLVVEDPDKEIEVEKEVAMDTDHGGKNVVDPQEAELVIKFESGGHCSITKDTSTWKMDIHSLGVSYNIKRLKQQLTLLDKLVGISRSCKSKDSGYNSHFRTKGFVVVMSLLNKQVNRYQSLQEKIDDLCKRMHGNVLDGCGGGSRIAKTKREIKILQSFLEEALQLQRYMVATGQKLVEIHSRIASAFISSDEEANRSSNFDIKRFTESVRAIFKEVQKGFEVQIARVIGDLEGTLTCNGITHYYN